jgi:putative nucleotidyltransferase with HDIG domain
MVFVPVEQLRAGMVLAKSIETGIDNCVLPLLVEGRVLSERLIGKLRDRNIPGIYIKTDFSEDITPGELVDPQLKKKALRTIKRVFDDVAQYSAISIDNTSSITEIARELVLEILSADEILIDFLDLKDYDDYTYRHSLSVAVFSISIGRKLGYSTDVLIDIATGALLHDIGKTEIPIEIINKPGRLTDGEYEIVRKHPDIAYKYLQGRKMPDAILKGIRSHHERYNGTGYPDGSSGENIPMYGRILTVSDVYDALTSLRPYRKAWFPNEALEYMIGSSGIYFDPDIVDVFLKIVVPYPIGTIVQLSNGCPAIVLKTNENKLRPVVRMFNASDDTAFIDVDLMNDKSYMNVTIVSLGYNSRINYDSFILKPEDEDSNSGI